MDNAGPAAELLRESPNDGEDGMLDADLRCSRPTRIKIQ